MSGDDLRVLDSGIGDADPLLRIAAHRVLRELPGDIRSRFGFEGLADPVRGVRITAALAFADQHDLLPAADAARFRVAAGEFRAAHEYSSSRPESLSQLGDFELATGKVDGALAHYRSALAVEPASAAVRVNLADIHRATGDEAEAERVLREGLELQPANAAMLHSLGLLLARTDRLQDGLAVLREAVRADPENRRFVYVLGVALNSTGEGNEAVAVLQSARGRFPTDFDIAWALATIHRDRGEVRPALSVAEDLLKRHPQQAEVVALHRSLSATR
jgi:Flp pilus assembly protein TadD